MRPDRKALDRAVADEERVLAGCVDLLERRIPLEAWDDESAAAFSLALAPPGEFPDFERRKAYYLARHLRIDQTELVSPAHDSERIRRLAERIRADLLRLVPLGAGAYLYQA